MCVCVCGQCNAVKQTKNLYFPAYGSCPTVPIYIQVFNGEPSAKYANNYHIPIIWIPFCRDRKMKTVICRYSETTFSNQNNTKLCIASQVAGHIDQIDSRWRHRWLIWCVVLFFNLVFCSARLWRIFMWTVLSGMLSG